MFRLVIFLFCLFVVSVRSKPSPVCWNFPLPHVNCTTSGPYIDGPFAFVVRDRTEALYHWTRPIVKMMEVFDVVNWEETVPESDYHVSINYMYCLEEKYANRVKKLLSSFKWKSFDIHLDHACCTTDGGWKTGVCVDKNSQELIANFSRSVKEYLRSGGVPLEGHEDWQPFFHMTMGKVSDSYDMVGLFDKTKMVIDSYPQLEMIQFQNEIYYATDYTEHKDVDSTARVLIVLFLILTLVFIGVWFINFIRSNQRAMITNGYNSLG